MNRLTKQIQLVLISSSLVLAGCAKDCEEEKQDQTPQQTTGSSSGSHGGHTGFHHYPVFIHGPAARPGTGGAGGHSSIGGSTRGGFGASAHGVGS